MDGLCRRSRRVETPHHHRFSGSLVHSLRPARDTVQIHGPALLRANRPSIRRHRRLARAHDHGSNALLPIHFRDARLGWSRGERLSGHGRFREPKKGSRHEPSRGCLGGWGQALSTHYSDLIDDFRGTTPIDARNLAASTVLDTHGRIPRIRRRLRHGHHPVPYTVLSSGFRRPRDYGFDSEKMVLEALQVRGGPGKSCPNFPRFSRIADFGKLIA